MAQVCMIVHQNYYRDGRVKRYVDTLLRAGIAVDVIGLRGPVHEPAENPPGLRVYSIPLTKRAVSTAGYMLEYVQACLLFTLWLLALYVRNRYRVIHVHNMPDFLVFTALVPRLLGARLILDIHDPMPEFYMSKYDDHRPDRLSVRLMRWQERLATRFAHRVLTANHNFRQNLIQRGLPPAKIAVTHNFPDSVIFDRTRYSHRGPGEHFTLIYPGTIAPRYGLEVAIRALPLMVGEAANLRLRIIGPSNSHRDELTALAQQLNVQNYVEFCPAIPISAVPEQMHHADLGVYPALPDPHMSIATPSKVLEFALMGLPIVASRLKVLEDLFPEDGIAFVEPGSAEQFAAAVLALYRDPARRNHMRQTVDRCFVEKNSWEQEARAYMDVLWALWPRGDGQRHSAPAQEQQRDQV